MSNDFGSLANSELIHGLMDDLKTDLKPLLGLATNFGERTADGGLIRTLRPGTTVTITDWSKAFTPYAYSAGPGYIAPDYTKKTFPTFQLPTDWKAVSMAITPAEYMALNGAPRGGLAYNELLTKAREMMLHGLKKAMITDFHAIITAANYTNNTVTAAATYARSKEIDIDTALFSRDLMSRANATTILPPGQYGSWAKDLQTVQNYTGLAQSDLLMSGGRQSGASPLTHWRTNIAMPTDAAQGYTFTKSAAIFIARIPDEASYANDPVDLQEVVDPETGLAFLARVWKNASTGTIQFDIALMWKFGKLQGEALQRHTAS